MSKGPYTILIVEDDRFLRRAGELALKSRGITVITACDGEEGLMRAHATPPPDLILLDMQMPRMGGLDMLRALRADQRTHAQRVLILSNSSGEATMQAAAALGVDGYWVKSNVSLHELGNRVIALLEQPRNHDDASSAG